MGILRKVFKPQQLTVKVGPKRRHLKIPDGAVLIKEGPIEHGDLVADIHKGRWGFVDDEDVGLDAQVYDHVCRPPQQGRRPV